MRKNMPESALDKSNPMYRTQQIMMYGMPIMYIFMGGVLQVAVLVYWVAGNIWNLCQQAWFIRNNPTPGSQAYKERQKRLREKRERKGLSKEEIEKLESEDAARAGGRVQPLGKERSKKAAAKAANRALHNDADDSDVDEADSDKPEEVRGKDGLTEAERARRRYERRQAERARAKNKAANRKKRPTEPEEAKLLILCSPYSNYEFLCINESFPNQRFSLSHGFTRASKASRPEVYTLPRRRNSQVRNYQSPQLQLLLRTAAVLAEERTIRWLTGPNSSRS